MIGAVFGANYGLKKLPPSTTKKLLFVDMLVQCACWFELQKKEKSAGQIMSTWGK
jgi:hypothetical protein